MIGSRIPKVPHRASHPAAPKGPGKDGQGVPAFLWGALASPGSTEGRKEGFIHTLLGLRELEGSWRNAGAADSSSPSPRKQLWGFLEDVLTVLLHFYFPSSQEKAWDASLFPQLGSNLS